MKKVVRREPKLRFPEFQGDWNSHKTNELFDRIKNGVEVRQDEFYQEIGIRSHGKGVFHKTPVLGKSLGNKRVFWIKKNVFILNIVFAWEQAVAKTTENEIGLIASHRFPMFEPKKGLADLDYFLGFFLTKKGKHLLGLASPGGAGRNKTLGQKVFDELNVVHPSLPEQQKIASFLSAIDQNLQQLSRKKKLLEQYKKGVLQKIFCRQIRFQDENGQEYPDWQEKRLGDAGHFKGGGTPSTKTAEYWTGDIPWISSSDLTDESIYHINTTRFINKNALKNSATKLIPANSILIVSRVGVGKVAVNRCSLCTSQDFTNLVLFNDNPIFLAYFIKLTTKKLLEFNQGTSIKGIVKSDLEEIKIPIPSLKEQQKIASFLSNIDRKIETAQTQLTQTRTFKKGLLQQLFV
jgi:type I restriction enzyme S subunit